MTITPEDFYKILTDNIDKYSKDVHNVVERETTQVAKETKSAAAKTINPRFKIFRLKFVHIPDTSKNTQTKISCKT